MVITGYARRVAADLAPVDVITGEVAALGDPALLAANCLAGVDPGFAERAGEGDVLVLDGMLLAGPGAEAAIVALQAVGVVAVICDHAALVLVESGTTYGLPIVAAPGAAATIGEDALVRLDLERGQFEVEAMRWSCPPLDPDGLAAFRRAQTLVRMRRIVEDEGYAE